MIHCETGVNTLKRKLIMFTEVLMLKITHIKNDNHKLSYKRM